MNDTEKVEMNTAAYGVAGNNMVLKEYFIKGWENRAAYKGPGSTLPVSPAVLTKRELVAAMAMQGLLENPKKKTEFLNVTKSTLEDLENDFSPYVQEIVDEARIFADALLRELTDIPQ